MDERVKERGFSVTGEDIFFGTGEKREWLCQSFETRALDAGDGLGWGNLVGFEAEDGTHHEVFVGWADLHLHPYKSARRLIDLGMRVSGSRRAHLKLAQLLLACVAPPLPPSHWSLHQSSPP
jgi:hypothetical protein